MGAERLPLLAAFGGRAKCPGWSRAIDRKPVRSGGGLAEPNPATVIVADLLRRLAERPFEPFVLVLSNGSRHEVPTPDHCTVQRFSRRINVDHDDGSCVTINALHLAQIELLHKPAA